MILDEIANSTKYRLSGIDITSRKEMRAKAYNMPVNSNFPFFKALSKPDLSFIAEVKKASPSKGLICDLFDPLKIAKEYERIGIDAISVLTEPVYFLGSPKYLEEINKEINTPTLRKDFIIDLYQIHEAKVIGASAILLICALLDEKTLALFYKEATILGLDVLVETHNQEEVEKALNIDAKIIGVNNRDLKTFKVDLDNSRKLKKYIPSNKIMVSESGFVSRDDIIKAIDTGVDAVLIGESFMKSSCKESFLKSLKGV